MSFLYCRYLQRIEIPDDSKLQTIEQYAFYFTKIQSITIPSELVELKEGWCTHTINLNKIEVNPKNPRYCCYEDKMILGKTNIGQSNYDCLVFCVRDIENVTIPNFIEHICSYSFDRCKKLQQVEIPNDSKLQTIGTHAFFYSGIRIISIPSSVTLIGEGAFGQCKNLQRIEIPNDSKLQTIDKEAFKYSSINNIKIPSELIELKEGWCKFVSKLNQIEMSPKNPRYCCYEEKMILGKSNIDQSNFDCLIFCARDIQNVTIPNFIEHICSYSFDRCKKLQQVEIQNDSKLRTIDDEAFSLTAIKSIKIPSSVTLIGKAAFQKCDQLEIIKIPYDSKLQTIDDEAFSFTAIKSISIPSSVTMIGNNSFDDCVQLQIIEINNTELISMYCSIFQKCKNALLMIPVH